MRNYAFFKDLINLNGDGHPVIARLGHMSITNGWSRGSGPDWGWTDAWYSTALGRLMTGLK